MAIHTTVSVAMVFTGVRAVVFPESGMARNAKPDIDWKAGKMAMTTAVLAPNRGAGEV